LGASAIASDNGRAQAIIDPEALLLFSLYLEPAERRLRDFVYWWATVGSDLLSVQRTKTLVGRFPSVTEERLQSFAGQAMNAGDNRWRRYAPEMDEADNADRMAERALKGAEQPRLHPPPALLLRLRAGFGVSAKADVLAYLLGTNEYAATTQETADATGYARVTVRGALIDMVRAGFVRETGHGAARFFAPGAPWAQVLQFGEGDGPDTGSTEVPAWRYWSMLFPFLAHVDTWCGRDRDGESAYLLSTHARDIFEAYQSAFEINRIDVPRPKDYPGAAYLEAFEETVDALSQWLSAHL
ncbi:MAG: hypothetical protein GVY12_01385, partial [Bacteroidetes bacterium]|nr:hypothetical protein [Bacteroidota bacterium]